MARRTVVLALNSTAEAAQFEALAQRLPVDVRHRDFRFPWEEIAARRSGVSSTGGVAPVELQSACADAEVIFGFYLPRDLTQFAPRLRWVETPAAGSDHLRSTGVIESGITVTTAGSALAPMVAEHAFALLLGLCRNLPEAVQAQSRAEWRKTVVRELFGQCIAVVGLGRIGLAVARVAKAFGMRVIGIRRHAGPPPEHVDRMFQRGELIQMLAEADVVVLALPATSETVGLIGDAELAAMKPGAYLINVARGVVVDEAALVRAIRLGRLAGVGLDVFTEEPLPPDSHLWHQPNVLITPHTAVDTASRLERTVTHFGENLARYCSGEPLRDQVDWQRGY
jgi:phosphoglycerate dehydrogenase-like enzyme